MFGIKKCQFCNEYQMTNDICIKYMELKRENAELKRQLEEKMRPAEKTEREK